MGGRCSAGAARRGDTVSRSERAASARGVRRARGERFRARASPLVGRLGARAARQPVLTLALGRRSGGAAVRSRVKRIVRDVFRKANLELPPDLRVEIGAEGDLSRTPRRAVRRATEVLLRRLIEQWQAGRSCQNMPVGAPSH